LLAYDTWYITYQNKVEEATGWKSYYSHSEISDTATDTTGLTIKSNPISNPCMKNKIWLFNECSIYVGLETII